MIGSTVLFISELQHEFMACLGVLLDFEARLISISGTPVSLRISAAFASYMIQLRGI